MTLQPIFAVSAGIDTKSNSANDLETLENRFSALEVEEPAETQDGVTTIALRTVAQPAYELESPKIMKDREQEKLFALFCLFDDYARLRTYIAGLWIKYKLGQVDFVTASVVSNTAIQLAIRTEEEFIASYPDCPNYDQFLTTFLGALGSSDDEQEIEIDDAAADCKLQLLRSITSIPTILRLNHDLRAMHANCKSDKHF